MKINHYIKYHLLYIMNTYSKIFLLSIFVILLIFLYQLMMIYLEIPLSNDPLQYKLFNNINNINGWSITHFIVFTLAGYYGHKHIFLLMLIGILWELTEILLSFITKISFADINIKMLLKNKRKIDNNSKNFNWWYGRYEDIIVNFIGLMTGKYLLRKII